MSPTDETKYRILHLRMFMVFILLGVLGYQFFYNKYQYNFNTAPVISQTNLGDSFGNSIKNEASNIPSVDNEYTILRPMFKIGDGDVITTELISALSSDLMMESSLYLRQSDNSTREIIRMNLLSRILQVIPDRSDSERVLFTEIPEGVGGYILSRIVPSLYSIDVTNNFKVTKLGDRELYSTVRTFFDATKDNRYLAVSINDNRTNIVDTPAILDRNTGKIAKMDTYNTKEFPLVVDMFFSENEKTLTLVVARNNPDTEEFATSTLDWAKFTK